jgi:hypothetical protein
MWQAIIRHIPYHEVESEINATVGSGESEMQNHASTTPASQCAARYAEGRV